MQPRTQALTNDSGKRITAQEKHAVVLGFVVRNKKHEQSVNLLKHTIDGGDEQKDDECVQNRQHRGT